MNNKDFISFLNTNIKKMKLSANDEYIYIDDNKIVNISDYCIKCLEFNDILSDVYNHKIISIDYIKNVSETYCATELGILKGDYDDSVVMYKCKNIYDNMINMYNKYRNYRDLSYNIIRYENIDSINNDIINMRTLKSADGCINVKLDNSHIVTLSPTFIPMKKSDKLNVNIYDNIDNRTFQCVFEILSNKKNDSILTISMHFLKI